MVISSLSACLVMGVLFFQERAITASQTDGHHPIYFNKHRPTLANCTQGRNSLESVVLAFYHDQELTFTIYSRTRGSSYTPPPQWPCVYPHHLVYLTSNMNMNPNPSKIFSWKSVFKVQTIFGQNQHNMVCI